MSPEISADLVGEFEQPAHVPMMSRESTVNSGLSDFIFSYFSSELGQDFCFDRPPPMERSKQSIVRNSIPKDAGGGVIGDSR
jgi:hypothetical protein